LSRLNQEGVLPLAAAASTQRLLSPDTSRRQTNNILFWLRGASRAEFERFIAIVRETGGDSRPHEELAQELEEEYGRLRNDSGGRFNLADGSASVFLQEAVPCSHWFCGYRFTSTENHVAKGLQLLVGVIRPASLSNYYLNVEHGISNKECCCCWFCLVVGDFSQQVIFPCLWYCHP